MCGPTIIDNVDTQAISLEGILTQQTAAAISTMAADCTPMGDKAACVSIGGRMTDVHDGAGAQALVVSGAYQIAPRLRVGLTLDQVVSNDSTAGTEADNGQPMVGLFGTWTQNSDGTGLGVRIAAAYGETDVTVQSVSSANSSELFVAGLGVGTADLTTQAASVIVSYATRMSPTLMLTPYAGLQRTDLSRAGYTEAVTGDAPYPYTYGAVDDVATTALLGFGLTSAWTSTFTLGFRAGLEYDLDRDTGILTAVNDQTDEAAYDLGDDARQARATAAISGTYTLPNATRLGFNIGYRQDAFSDTNSTTATVTYAAGF